MRNFGNRSDRGHDIFLIPPAIQRWRRTKRREPVIIAAVLLALITAVGAWLWIRSGSEPEAPVAATEATDAAGPGDAADPFGDLAAEPPPLDLPALDASDAFIRDVVARLSEHPEWLAWLANEDLVRRFVVSVVNVAGGSSPAAHLPFLAPEEEFTVAVRDSDGGAFIDPESYRRYDLLTATFVSLDTEGVARLYRQLHPLFEEAHRELGFADGTFDDQMAGAFRTLLEVEVPREPVEVESEDGVFVFQDENIEARSAAAKHLLRLGPENALRVQAKLEELASVLGLRMGDALTDPAGNPAGDPASRLRLQP